MHAGWSAGEETGVQQRRHHANMSSSTASKRLVCKFAVSLKVSTKFRDTTSVLYLDVGNKTVLKHLIPVAACSDRGWRIDGWSPELCYCVPTSDWDLWHNYWTTLHREWIYTGPRSYTLPHWRGTLENWTEGLWINFTTTSDPFGAELMLRTPDNWTPYLTLD